MHFMLQRAAVTTGALSALLGLAVSPGYAVAAPNAGQTPVGSKAASGVDQPAGLLQPSGTSHGSSTKAERATPRTATSPKVSPRQALNLWTCSASLDNWSPAYQCPALSSGFYTFTNASSGNDGIVVFICKDTPDQDSCNTPGSAFGLSDQGDSQVGSVPPGYNVYIEGEDWVEHEQLTLTATPSTSRTGAGAVHQRGS